MELQVDRPNLNRGTEAGLRQESFGNYRDNNFSFPSGLSSAQPPPVPYSQPRMTWNVPILPTENNWDTRWNMGTLYFGKKDLNQLKQLFCLSYARALMAQSAITRHEETKRNARMTQDEIDLEGTGGLKHFTKSRARDYGFMGSMETIAKELDFCGVGFGPVDPSLQIGTADMGNSARYSGHAKQVPMVVQGHCFMPNLWETKLRAGQDLFVILKPRIPGKRFYNTAGETMVVPSDIRDWDTIPDFSFYTNEVNKPPVFCSDNTALFENKGGQPPLHDRSYIDWECDADGKIRCGELKDGLVWKLGRVYSLQTSRAANTSRLTIKSSDPLQWARDYNTFPMMEVQLDPQRIY